MLKARSSWMWISGVFLILFLMSGCGGSDEKPITLKITGPQSMSGTYAEAGARVINGANAAIKWINDTHGGIKAGGKTYLLELASTDDQSSEDKVKEITAAECANVDAKYIIAPYSSKLTLAAAPITEACAKLLLVTGGASDSIYQKGYLNVVASIGPGSVYHKGILDAIKAKTNNAVSTIKVGFAYEDDAFSKTVRDAAKTYAQNLGYLIGYGSDKVYPTSATDTTQGLLDFVTALKADNPDIILGGGHDVDGRALAKKLGEQSVKPKALSLLVAPLGEDYYNLVKPCADPCDFANHPAEGLAGPSHWEVGATFNKTSAEADGSEWFGPSQEEFLTLYKAVAGADQKPSYHSGNGAVMILSLALAMEKAKSIETAAVRQAMGNLKFMSFWGYWGIDSATGANSEHKMVEVQWIQGKKQIVWPVDGKTADFAYPIH